MEIEVFFLLPLNRHSSLNYIYFYCFLTISVFCYFTSSQIELKYLFNAVAAGCIINIYSAGQKTKVLSSCCFRKVLWWQTGPPVLPPGPQDQTASILSTARGSASGRVVILSVRTSMFSSLISPGNSSGPMLLSDVNLLTRSNLIDVQELILPSLLWNYICNVM